jgi:hypothetical protein
MEARQTCSNNCKVLCDLSTEHGGPVVVAEVGKVGVVEEVDMGTHSSNDAESNQYATINDGLQGPYLKRAKNTNDTEVLLVAEIRTFHTTSGKMTSKTSTMMFVIPM